MSALDRAGRALVGAVRKQPLALAAALVVALLCWRAPRPLVAVASELSVEIEIPAERPPVDGRPLVRMTPEPISRSRRRPPPPRPTRARPLDRTADPPPPVEPEPYPAPPSAVEIGLWHALLPDDGAPAPTSPPARRFDPDAATRLLEDGLLEEDEKIGLSFPGATEIADAIADATRLHAPPVSDASFAVHVGSDGRVSSVRLLVHHDGLPTAWERVAGDSTRRLAGRRFAMRALLEDGAFLHVQVTSNVELPSGGGRERRFVLPPRFEKPRWPWAPSPGGLRKSRREEGSWTPLPAELRGVCPEPESALPACDPRETLCPGGTFDVADIGATPARIVRTRVQVEPVRARVGPRARFSGSTPR